MQKLIVILALALLWVVVPATMALAATTQDVTIDATPSFISISDSPASFDFGVVVTSSTPNTTTGYFTVTNDSTVNIDVTIQCTSPWEGGTNDWTYGAPAADTAQLKASDNDGAYDVTVLTASPSALHTTATAGADFQWELQLDAPTSFNYGNAQQCTVTLSASPV